jgi:C4-dicarboxylate transporter, DctM subunit
VAPENVGLLGIAVLIALLFLGMPIGTALGITGFGGAVWLLGLDGALGLLRTLPFSSTFHFTWTAIPLFILMGNFAARSGAVAELFDAAHKWLGWIPGGLCVATVAGCAGFGAVSGSSVATAGAIGKIALPEMVKRRYDPALSSGCVAASGTLGSLIPPSIFMVVYGILTESSIGKLFLAGILPGLISAALYMAVIGVRVGLKPALAPRAERVTWSERWRSLRGLAGVVMLAVLVLGGIYSGIWTPTEAAAAGAVAALVIYVLRRGWDWAGLGASALDTVRLTCSLFFIVIGAYIFAALMAVSRIPAKLTEAIIGAGLSQVELFVALFFLFLFLGSILEPIGMMLLTLPIIFPTVKAAGFDPIHFGILMVKFSEIGMITPPVGLNVYVIRSVIPDIKTETVFRGILLFFAVDVVTIVLLFTFPSISLIIPRLMR